MIGEDATFKSLMQKAICLKSAVYEALLERGEISYGNTD